MKNPMLMNYHYEDDGNEEIHTEPSFRQSRSWLQWATFSLSLTAVIVTSFTLIFVAVHSSHGNADEKAHTRQQTAYFGENGVCISCSNLGSEASSIMKQLKRTYKDEEDLCCANNSDEMSTLLELVIRIRGLPEAKLPVTKGTKTLKVSPVGSGTQHNRGVVAAEDFLYIEHTGIYYVFASLHISASTNLAGKMFYADLYRLSDSQWTQTGVLTRVAHKVCGDCELDKAFGGGIFKLFEGDRIQIRAKDSTRMALKQDSFNVTGMTRLICRVYGDINLFAFAFQNTLIHDIKCCITFYSRI